MNRFIPVDEQQEEPDLQVSPDWLDVSIFADDAAVCREPLRRLGEHRLALREGTVLWFL